MVKLLIAGSRSLDDYSYVTQHIYQGLTQLGLTPSTVNEVVSGMARGVDQVAVSWARNMGIAVLPMPADWHTVSGPNVQLGYRWGRPYNIRAGFERNERMADAASHAIILIRNGSAGSRHMLSLVHGRIPVAVFEDL